MLVTVEDYIRITGDSDSDDVLEALADAQSLIEEELGRPLELAERTEVMVVVEGRVYPKATPITVAPYPIDGYWLYDVITANDLTVDWFSLHRPRVTVTYTGGYTPETLPVRLKEAICRVAHRQLHPPAFDENVPIGASSVRVGDVAVTYGAGGNGVNTTPLIPPSAMVQIRPYRWTNP